MSSSKRFRVVVCGAGIAGLTAAVALSKYPDIDVAVYESADDLAEVGAGIGLFPRTWEIITLLDLDQDLLRLSDIRREEGPVTAFSYRKSDQPQGLDFYSLVTKGNLMTFHRAVFQRALLRRLPNSCRVQCSRRLRSYTQRPSGPIELLFEDGSTTSCDLLIGADGIKSAVRRTLLDEQRMQSKFGKEYVADPVSSAEPVWSGTIAYRALIPAERLVRHDPSHRVFTQPTQYLGKNNYIIAYPISQGAMVNFVAFHIRPDLEGTTFNGPWVSNADRSDLSDIFSHWEPEVQTLIDCIGHSMRWAVHTVRPLNSFISGHAVLIGDAAHAMTPHQGSGAGQAIEDAYLLATVLGHPSTTLASLDTALRIYDEIRRPEALKVMEKSRLNGQYFALQSDDVDFDSLCGDQLWDKLQELASTFTKNWEWAWSTSVNDLVQRVIHALEA